MSVLLSGLILSLAFPVAPSVRPSAGALAPLPVEAARDALEDAARSSDRARRVAAIRVAAEHPDAGIVDLIASLLAADDVAVRRSALDGLGRSPLAQSQLEIERFYRRERVRLALDTKELVVCLRAAARQGRSASVDLLVADVHANTSPKVLRARLFGLANVRSRAATEAAFYLVSQLDAEQFERSSGDIRLALTRLTGVDQAYDAGGWMAWWKRQHADLQVPEQVTPLRKGQRKAWVRFWGPSGDVPL